VPDDIGIVEIYEIDTGYPIEDVLAMDQAAGLVFGKVNLGDITGDDEFGQGSHPCEKHFKLCRGGILGFVEDGENVVECPATHKSQGGYFDDPVFNILQQFLRGEHIAQCVVQRLEVGIKFFFQIAGKKSEVFACFHGRTGKDDALYLFVFEGTHGQSHSGIGLSCPGRPDGKNQVVFQGAVDQPLLIGCACPDQHSVFTMDQHIGNRFGSHVDSILMGVEQMANIGFIQPAEFFEMEYQSGKPQLKIEQIGLFPISFNIIITGNDLQLWEKIPDQFKILVVGPENIQRMNRFNVDNFLAHEKFIPLITQKYEYFMAIITLTSDWGLKDYYAGVVKGAILKKLPGVQIVDISHQVPVFDLNQAAFIVRNSYRVFPAGTVHIIAINSEAAIETPHTLVSHHGHFFIGADNGIFSLLFDEKPEQIIELDVIQDSDYFTFPARDVFVKVACHIAEGKPLSELGHPKDNVLQKMAFQPVIQEGLIKGKVIYIDNYENVYVNITESLFISATTGRKFAITFRSPSYRITEISKSYKDVHQGEMLALLSASGYLEIAIREGKASSLLGLKMDQLVIVELH